MAKAAKFYGCTLKELPEADRLAAARMAIEVNPVNAPKLDNLASVAADMLNPHALAVLTSKYFGAKGVRLSVSFLDSPSAALRDKILAHMNAWSQWCNARFEYTAGQGQVRVARGAGGYWSYLGTDVLLVPAGQATMNLQGFTVNTSEAEYKRVVRHETGHTLGFPHEHLRRQLVARLDSAKTLKHFRDTQGWDEETTRRNVLTPVSDAEIIGTPDADDDSIMAYMLDGRITKDGRPIPGGLDINETDAAFAARIYPAEVIRPPVAPNVVHVDIDKKQVVFPAGWTGQSVTGV